MNTKLVRTRGGAMVHRADCPYVQPRPRVKAPPWQYRSPSGGVPWDWADDKSPSEILHWIFELGYQTCKHCDPFDGWRVLGLAGSAS